MTDAPSAWRIEQALATWHATRSRLLNDDADLAHDEAALAELLGHEDGDVQDILARLLRATVHATAMADSAEGMVRNLTSRRDRYKRRADTCRATAFALMDVLGKTKAEFPDVTATIRAGGQAVIITDEDALPPEFVRIETKPDKVAIMAAIKAGRHVDGAELANAMPSLQIRSK